MLVYVGWHVGITWKKMATSINVLCIKQPNSKVDWLHAKASS